MCLHPQIGFGWIHIPYAFLWSLNCSSALLWSLFVIDHSRTFRSYFSMHTYITTFLGSLKDEYDSYKKSAKAWENWKFFEEQSPRPDWLDTESR